MVYWSSKWKVLTAFVCLSPLKSMVHGDCGVNGQSVMHVRVCLSGSESVPAPLLDLEVCHATASPSRLVVAMTTKPSAQVSFPHTQCPLLGGGAKKYMNIN